MKGEVKLAVDEMRCAISTGNEEQHQNIVLQFNVIGGIQDLARALYWQKNNAPLYLIIGSNQIEMDLKVESINYQLPMPPTPLEAAIQQKIEPGTTALRAGEPLPGSEKKPPAPPLTEGKQCVNCGFVATNEDLEEQGGENACPSCGKSMVEPELDKQKKCRNCGCTEETPCASKNGLPCSWVPGEKEPLCSVCKAKQEEDASREFEQMPSASEGVPPPAAEPKKRTRRSSAEVKAEKEKKAADKAAADAAKNQSLAGAGVQQGNAQQ